MYSPYNLSQDTSLSALVTSQLYIAAHRSVAQLLCLENLPLFYQFATNVSETSFAPTTLMPHPVVDGMVPQPKNYAFNNNVSNNPCMFVYSDYQGVNWDKRICGSTDNHISRPNERVRAFQGDILQTRNLLKNMCCDTGFINQRFDKIMNEFFSAFMNSLSQIMGDILINAIFAPATQKDDTGVKTVTFLDDTTEIDLTGNVVLKTVMQKLSAVDLNGCMTEYYWFVPQEYYGALNSLTTTTACCSMLSLATINVNGSPMSMGYGLQFSSMPFIKIFPLPKKYFPLNPAGKVYSMLMPRGSVAFTIQAPTMLNMPNTGGVSPMDIMSFSQQSYDAEFSRNLGQSAVQVLLSNPQAALNYNGEIAAFTTIVAGRLPNKRMYRVLVEAAPVTA